jgi:hypothetical protein
VTLSAAALLVIPAVATLAVDLTPAPVPVPGVATGPAPEVFFVASEDEVTVAPPVGKLVGKLKVSALQHMALDSAEYSDRRLDPAAPVQ